MMYAAGMQEAETVYCNVNIPSVAPFRFLNLRTQGKIKRTQSFYVDEFKFIKSITAPEVCLIWKCFSVLTVMLTILGYQVHQNHNVLAHLVSSAPWIRRDVRFVCVQGRWCGAISDNSFLNSNVLVRRLF